VAITGDQPVGVYVGVLRAKGVPASRRAIFSRSSSVSITLSRGGVLRGVLLQRRLGDRQSPIAILTAPP
jgi:hypothetical protein